MSVARWSSGSIVREAERKDRCLWRGGGVAAR